MTHKVKGRAGCHRATLDHAASASDRTSPTARVKAFIQTLAVWGLLPVGIAEWLLRKGGLHDA